MSDEQLAIMELNANMTKRFNELNQRIEQMENVLMSDAVEAEYGQVFNCVLFDSKLYLVCNLKNELAYRDIYNGH